MNELVATQIRNIVFEKPVDMYVGDQLTVVFEKKIDGITCVMTLKTADSQKIVIGDEVEQDK